MKKSRHVSSNVDNTFFIWFFAKYLLIRKIKVDKWWHFCKIGKKKIYSLNHISQFMHSHHFNQYFQKKKNHVHIMVKKQFMHICCIHLALSCISIMYSKSTSLVEQISCIHLILSYTCIIISYIQSQIIGLSKSKIEYMLNTCGQLHH